MMSVGTWLNILLPLVRVQEKNYFSVGWPKGTDMALIVVICEWDK